MEAIIAIAIMVVSLTAGVADLTATSHFETTPPAVETPPLEPLATVRSTAHIPISFPVARLSAATPYEATPPLEPLPAVQSTARIPVSFPVDRFDAGLPRAPTASLPPLEARRSSFRLPVSVRVASLERELDRSVARTRTVSGSTKWLLGRIRYDVEVERSAITLGESDGSLAATTDAAITGPVSWWLFSGTLNASARIQATVNPVVQGGWHVSPGLALTGRVASARLSSFLPDLGVRRLVARPVDDFLAREQRKLEDSISNSDFIETIARKGWQGLCRSFPISSDPEVWLEVKPTAVSAADPSIDGERMNTELALEFELRVVDRETSPECGFPDVAGADGHDAGDSGIDIVLPVEIGYDTVTTFLDEQLGGRSFSSEDYSVTFDTLELRPYGRAVLFRTDIIIGAPGWFETPARGSVYVSAEPRLDVDEQRLSFENLQLDTSSREALIGLGLQIAEPVILDALTDVSIDLAPHLARLEEMAEEALARLEGSIPGVAIATTRPEIRLDRIDVGREYLRVVARVTGNLTVDVQTLPWRSDQNGDN